VKIAEISIRFRAKDRSPAFHRSSCARAAVISAAVGATRPTVLETEGDNCTLDEILAQVASYPASTLSYRREPMIAPDIVTLTGVCAKRGLHITIETAGTVFEPVDCDLMSISPKLANSRPKEAGPAA